MATEIKVPTLGESVTEATVAKWLKNVGDAVKVKVLGFDERGKVKLSMRVVDQASGEDITEKVGAKPGRGDRRERREQQPTVEAVPPEIAEQPAIGE